MQLDRNNRVAILQREERVWGLLVKGLQGIEVAQREGVTPQMISIIKRRVERRVVKELHQHHDTLKARQLAEIRQARREGGEPGKNRASRLRRRSGGSGKAKPAATSR